MTINLALVGHGYWGPNLFRSFNGLPGVRVRTLCDLREGVLSEFSARNPDVAVTSDIENVLNDPEVQAVVISTPAETHFKLAKRALQAGKDVLVEKPLALTYADGYELTRLGQDLGRILMVGHVLEYHPGIVRLQELVRDGVLGKIRYIYSNRLSLGKIRREENILWSFAPHDIAVVLRLMGGLPFQVVACGGGYVQPNIADVTVTNLLFDNGVRAHIFVSWLHPFKEQRLVVIGSKKMASFDDVTTRLVLYDQHVDLKEGEPIPVKGEGEVVSFSSAEPLKLECEEFIKAITTRQAPLTDGESGLRVLRVLQAAQRSLITNGDPVMLPVVANELPTFVNPAVASSTL
jgi:predicted dehydrogenase